MAEIEQIKQELKAAAQRHDGCEAWQQMLDHAIAKATGWTVTMKLPADCTDIVI